MALGGRLDRVAVAGGAPRRGDDPARAHLVDHVREPGRGALLEVRRRRDGAPGERVGVRVGGGARRARRPARRCSSSGSRSPRPSASAIAAIAAGRRDERQRAGDGAGEVLPASHLLAAPIPMLGWRRGRHGSAGQLLATALGARRAGGADRRPRRRREGEGLLATGSPPPTSPRARRSSGRTPTRAGTTYVQLVQQGRVRRLRQADTRSPRSRRRRSNDNTVQKKVKELDPDTDYEYRYCTPSGGKSDTGKFTTAPTAKQERDDPLRAHRRPGRPPGPGRRHARTGTTSRSGTRSASRRTTSTS